MGVTMSEPMTDKATDRVKDDRFTVGASSMQGWRMSMEDAHTLHLQLPGDKSAAFFAVYDGHGGSKVAMYASENLHRHIVDNDHYTKGDYIKALEEGFLSLDRELYEVYNTSAKLAGSTAICLLIVKNKIYCANIGDSRAVASVDSRCVALSLDHKPDNDIEYRRIVAAGGYIEANRVNGNLALSRAFGDFHYKSNELLPAQDQIVSPFPDIKVADLNGDLDFLVLACDGIWDVLTNEEVVDFVASRLEEEMEPGLICEQLMSRCLAPDCDLVVGCDNMTVVLICHTRGLGFPVYCESIWNKYSGKINRSDHYGQGYSEQSAEEYHDIPQDILETVACQSQEVWQREPSCESTVSAYTPAPDTDNSDCKQGKESTITTATTITTNSTTQLETEKETTEQKSVPPSEAATLETKDKPESTETPELSGLIDKEIKNHKAVGRNEKNDDQDMRTQEKDSSQVLTQNIVDSQKNQGLLLSPKDQAGTLGAIDKFGIIDENSNREIKEPQVIEANASNAGPSEITKA